MVRKPVSSDPEQREKDSERSRKASQLSAAGNDMPEHKQPRPSRARHTPSNGGPEEESAHGALMREGIDSD
jgi:hypothetical protein